jgi:hypothetical protein
MSTDPKSQQKKEAVRKIARQVARKGLKKAVDATGKIIRKV